MKNKDTSVKYKVNNKTANREFRRQNVYFDKLYDFFLFGFPDDVDNFDIPVSIIVKTSKGWVYQLYQDKHMNTMFRSYLS